jgi:hypothetical protein
VALVPTFLGKLEFRSASLAWVFFFNNDGVISLYFALVSSQLAHFFCANVTLSFSGMCECSKAFTITTTIRLCSNGP